MTPVINLFFVPYSFSGVTTYCQALMDYFSRCEKVKMHIVRTSSDKPEFTVVDRGSVTEIFIPKPSSEIDNQAKYIDQCVLLLYAEFHHLSRIVFHFNMKECIDMAKAVSRRFRCKIVYTLHFLESHYSAVKYLGIPMDQIDNRIDIRQQQMLALANHIICVTYFASEIIKDWYGVSLSKISVIHNGIESIPEHRILSWKEKEDIKTSLGVQTHERIILYAGRLNRNKGIYCLIRAFKEVVIHFPKSRLIIAGGCSDYDYHKLCKGIYDKVTFAGNLDKETLQSFYKIADVGVVPSHFEQCSYVAIEMMQFGLPIVVSDLPGLKELFEHRQNALLCPLRRSANNLLMVEPDISSLGKQIVELLSNSYLASGLSMHAQKKVREEFSLIKMGDSTLGVYLSSYNLEKNIGGNTISYNTTTPGSHHNIPKK
jgi:glycosyltransferase involved in cell wall biosynthesis